MPGAEVKEEVWQTIQALNRAWGIERDIEKLGQYFHQDMVAITPNDRERLEGWKACIASWEAFVKSAIVAESKEIAPKVQLYGDNRFAVVTYYYDMTCNSSLFSQEDEFLSQASTKLGHILLFEVFVRVKWGTED